MYTVFQKRPTLDLL